MSSLLVLQSSTKLFSIYLDESKHDISTSTCPSKQKRGDHDHEQVTKQAVLFFAKDIQVHS